MGRVIIASALLLPLAWSASAAEPVKVRTGLHGDHARLVFDWPRPSAFEATAGPDGLRVYFARPLRLETAAEAIALKGFIDGAQLLPDRQTMVFRLARPISIKAFALDRRAVIDLFPARAFQSGAVTESVGRVPKRSGATSGRATAAALRQSWQRPDSITPVSATVRAPAPLPPAPVTAALATRPASAAAAPEIVTPSALPSSTGISLDPTALTVPVQVSATEARTTLFFNWPSGVQYGVHRREDGNIELHFSRPGRMAFEAGGAQADGARPRSFHLRRAQTQVLPGGTVVLLEVDPEVKLEHGPQGNAVAVDLVSTPNLLARIREAQRVQAEQATAAAMPARQVAPPAASAAAPAPPLPPATPLPAAPPLPPATPPPASVAPPTPQPSAGTLQELAREIDAGGPLAPSPRPTGPSFQYEGVATDRPLATPLGSAEQIRAHQERLTRALAMPPRDDRWQPDQLFEPPSEDQIEAIERSGQ